MSDWHMIGSPRVPFRLSTLKKHIFPRFCSPSVVPGLNDLLLLWGFRSAEQTLALSSRGAFKGSHGTRGCVVELCWIFLGGLYDEILYNSMHNGLIWFLQVTGLIWFTVELYVIYIHWIYVWITESSYENYERYNSGIFSGLYCLLRWELWTPRIKKIL